MDRRPQESGGNFPADTNPEYDRKAYIFRLCETRLPALPLLLGRQALKASARDELNKDNLFATAPRLREALRLSSRRIYSG